MKIKATACFVFLIFLASSTSSFARNWTSSSYTITKVYDQRPHKQQIDIDITPSLYSCSTLSFENQYSGLTDEHLDNVLSISLAALISGKEVGGLWSGATDAQNGICIATNIHISN